MLHFLVKRQGRSYFGHYQSFICSSWKKKKQINNATKLYVIQHLDAVMSQWQPQIPNQLALVLKLITQVEKSGIAGSSTNKLLKIERHGIVVASSTLHRKPERSLMILLIRFWESFRRNGVNFIFALFTVMRHDVRIMRKLGILISGINSG